MIYIKRTMTPMRHTYYATHRGLAYTDLFQHLYLLIDSLEIQYLIRIAGYDFHNPFLSTPIP
jgi:hypothetical protein